MQIYKIMTKSGIYKLFWDSGYFYIGRTKNLQARKNQHLSDFRLGRHCNRFLLIAYKRYGFPQFEILMRCEENELPKWEQYYIDQNIGNPLSCNAALCSLSNKGFKHSEETKAKYSETRKGSGGSMYGKHHSDATKLKMSLISHPNLHMKGIPKTPDHREKLRQAKLGTKHSEETMDKIRAASKKNGLHPNFVAAAAVAKLRKVKCLKTGMIYPSLTEAAKYIGIPLSTLFNRVAANNNYSYIN